MTLAVFILRDASPADVASLRRLEEACFAANRLSLRSLRRFVSSGTARVRVATVNGELAGAAVVLARRNSKAMRLYSLAVAHSFRGQGIGSALLADAEHVARSRGAALLHLELRRDNPGAERLYRRLGFKERDIIEDYYADGMAARRMVKRLEGAAA